MYTIKFDNLYMSRAMRRHHKDRMKKKAARIYPGWKDFHGNLVSPPQYYLADHLAVCSCYGCGNRRQYEGKTIAEKINMEEFHSSDLP